MREPLAVAVSLDVEEEGLFSGRYKCSDVSLRNIAHLGRLAPFLERGVRPTLFCAWSVLADLESLRILEHFLPSCEIGSHLHHWNTPPVGNNIPASGELFSVPANQVPLQCLDAKIDNLLEAGRNFLGAPVTSFRMGRWDLHRAALPLLAGHGILSDASVRPLHSFLRKDHGPDHFGAPADPYWIPLANGRLFEAPLTVVPLLAPFSHIPARFAWGRRMRASLRHWGALALLPVYHPLWLMRLTTNLHANGGGRAISLTWHSSEMMPGGNPRLADRNSVESFLARIMAYLDWLEANFQVKYVTLSELRNTGSWPVLARPDNCDWTCHEGSADAS